MTCAELAAVGLPAIFVPLPIGNGEQRINAEHAVAAGTAVMVSDGELTADWVASEVPMLFDEPGRIERMRAAAGASGHPDAASALVAMVAAAHRRVAPAGSTAFVTGTRTMGQVPADLPPELARVHLIGMGGAGMSGIARLLLARGGIVSGSDARDSRVLTALRQLGATVFVGHDAAHLAEVGSGPEPVTVVTSTAIRATNPELAEAHRLGLRVLPRAAALAALMSGRRGVAVAGTHGKTTTTSMLTVALQDAGLAPVVRDRR